MLTWNLIQTQPSSAWDFPSNRGRTDGLDTGRSAGRPLPMWSWPGPGLALGVVPGTGPVSITKLESNGRRNMWGSGLAWPSLSVCLCEGVVGAWLLDDERGEDSPR